MKRLRGTLMATIEKLKPVTAVDEHWPAADRDATLQRLLAVTAAEPPTPAPPKRRVRRALLTGAVAVGLLASGAGIATAGGLLPESLSSGLKFWASETDGQIDVQAARRVAQMPGPGDGTVLSVWSARADDGTVCVAPLFEAPGPLDRPAPKDFRLTGGVCNPPDLRTGAGLGGSATNEGIHTQSARLPGAVRAELRLADGTTRPALAAEGMFFYWYLANAQVDAPTLIGYDAAGNVVQEMPLPNSANGKTDPYAD